MKYQSEIRVTYTSLSFKSYKQRYLLLYSFTPLLLYYVLWYYDSGVLDHVMFFDYNDDKSEGKKMEQAQH